MISNTTVTADRKLFANFTIPYRKEMTVLYVKQEQLERCQNNSFLQLVDDGFRFGLARGNIYGKEILELQSKPKYDNKVVYLRTNRDGLSALRSNEIDGYFDDPAVYAYDSKKEISVSVIKPCKIAIYAENVSLMFSKKTIPTGIVERFNRAITAVQQTEYYKSTWDWEH